MSLEQTIIKHENQPQGYSLLDEVLKHQPESIRRKVRWLVEISGIREDDPLFLVLLSSRINHVLLEDAPSNLENSLDTCRVTLVKVQQEYLNRLQEVQTKYVEESKQVALDIAEAKVKSAIARILAENNLTKKGWMSPKVLGMITTSIAITISLTIGFIGGWSFDRVIRHKNNLMALSLAQRNLLDWAQSKEGKLAKQILDWNEDILDRECTRKVRSLNVTIRLGTAKATSGYCWVWIEPPSKRNFVSE